MAQLQGFDTRELENWQRQFLALKNRKVDQAKSRIMRSAGLRGLEVAFDSTPRDQGRLQNSLTLGAPDNVFLVRVNRFISDVIFGTSVYYAVFVEDGFQQRAGQFVPGEFRDYSGETIFRYDPEAKGGIVLKGRFIPGAKMFAKAKDALAEDFPRIIRLEIEAAARGVFLP